MPHREILEGAERYMSLVLIYRGLLPTVNDKNKRKEEKQIIRRVFHGQLSVAFKKPYMQLLSSPDLFRPQRVGDFNFHPLIFKDKWYGRRGCELDIKILSNDPFGAIYQSGDLDNRLKTLFDALCAPNKDQLAAGDYPQETEDPFWVLLSDDRLITDVHIVQDILNFHMDDENYVELTITVKIKDGYQA